jgi:Alpha/beta hydrolase family
VKPPIQAINKITNKTVQMLMAHPPDPFESRPSQIRAANSETNSLSIAPVRSGVARFDRGLTVAELRSLLYKEKPVVCLLQQCTRDATPGSRAPNAINQPSRFRQPSHGFRIARPTTLTAIGKCPLCYTRNPTLTGVGERSHLLSPQVNLDTHIADIVNLIQWEELSQVVLCGHSYGGCVVTGVADRVPDRIAELVYLDAFVPENGQSLHDTLPPEVRDAQVQGAQQIGDGWRVPPIPAEVFNVNSRDLDWVNRQCTMQPLATFNNPSI